MGCRPTCRGPGPIFPPDTGSSCTTGALTRLNDFEILKLNSFLIFNNLLFSSLFTILCFYIFSV